MKREDIEALLRYAKNEDAEGAERHIVENGIHADSKDPFPAVVAELCELALKGMQSETAAMFDVVQLTEARHYRDSKEPIGILARAILRANGEMK